MKTYTQIEKEKSALQKVEFVMVFENKLQQISDAIQQVLPKMESDVLLSFCHPKGTSKRYKCEYYRDNDWAALGQYNFEPVRMVAIDED